MNQEYFVRSSEGEPQVTRAGLALLLAVPEEDLRALQEEQGITKDGKSGFLVLPEEWVWQGRRNYRRAAAEIGTYELARIVAFLAREAGR